MTLPDARSAAVPARAADPPGAPRPTLPAVLVDRPGTGGLRLAGVSLLDRLVVAAHRAGCAPIIVVSGERPSLPRSAAWNIPVEVRGETPSMEGPVLAATTDQWVQASDLRRVAQAGGRLVTPEGRSLPAGVLPRLDALTGMTDQLERLPAVVALSACARVGGRDDLLDAERALWRSLTSSSDGLVDRFFNRPCGRLLGRWLVRTPVTPNAVSIASILIGVAGAWLLSLGDRAAALWGAVVFQVSAIVDCVDGDIARAKFRESPMGKWLDLVGDQVVHAAVFLGVAAGLNRAGYGDVVLWLGGIAVAGALLAFAVILRGLRGTTGGSGGGMQRLIDAMTNRDFSVVLLVLAVFGRLDWFLWMAAVGSHLFWMTALALQSVSGRGRAGA